ncbi:uncharacterized protein LOC142356276 [Convolutriloba macropyga]|uniref:uncharacterized protein LOC142356276 n=1 Tax=Convolutriloba macropyga TaxID=536237 RepID=UPI003F523E80
MSSGQRPAGGALFPLQHDAAGDGRTAGPDTALSASAQNAGDDPSRTAASAALSPREAGSGEPQDDEGETAKAAGSPAGRGGGHGGPLAMAAAVSELGAAAFSSYRPPDPGQAPTSRVQVPLRAADLQGYFASSSDDEDSSEDGDGPQTAAGPEAHAPVEGDPRTGGNSSDDRKRRKKKAEKKREKDRRSPKKESRKRKRDHSKHSHKEHRSRHSRQRQDADKVRELERKHHRTAAGEAAAGGASGGAGGSEPYLFDSHGDKDNLAYDSLYRAQTPSYHLYTARGGGSQPRRAAPRRPGGGLEDLGMAAGATSKDKRYFSASQARRERDRSSVRTRFHSNERSSGGGGGSRSEGRHLNRSSRPLLSSVGLDAEAGDRRLQLPLPAVIPLEQSSDGAGNEPGGRPGPGTPGAQAVMESVEEYIRRRTREFNEAVREEPWNLQTWLDYAAFQDQAVTLRQTRKLHLVEVAVAEKKLSILEKALQHIPSSEKLLLVFMDAMSVMATKPQMLTRWQRLLHRDGAAMPGLWERYLQLERGSCSDFRLAKLTDAYVEAIGAIGGQVARFRREEAPHGELLKIEEARVGFVLQAIQAWLQSGYTERGVATIQAALEFSVFSPPFPPSMGTDSAKAAEFKDFWRSGAPRIGDEGGRGWSRWAEGLFLGGQQAAADEEVKLAAAESEDDLEGGGGGGGWSEWRDLAPAQGSLEATPEEGAAGEEEPGAGGKATKDKAEGPEEDQPQEPEEEEETEEELMARLGMKLEAGLGAGMGEDAAISPAALANWVEEEVRRSTTQWHPIATAAGDRDGGGAEAEGEEEVDAERLVELDDMRSFLFSLDHCLEMREQLALGCCKLLGAPLGRGLCSNSRIACLLDSTSDSFSASDCKALTATLADVAEAGLDSDGWRQMAWLLPPGLESCFVNPEAGPPWERDVGGGGGAWWEADSSRRDFLRRLLRLLVTGPMSGQPALARALFRLEAASGGGKDSAKAILADRRDDLVLWGAYAEVEAENKRFKARIRPGQAAYQAVRMLLAIPASSE